MNIGRIPGFSGTKLDRNKTPASRPFMDDVDDTGKTTTSWRVDMRIAADAAGRQKRYTHEETKNMANIFADKKKGEYVKIGPPDVARVKNEVPDSKYKTFMKNLSISRNK